MKQDLKEGEKVNRARVVKRYYSGLGVQTAVLEPSQQTDEDHLIREMHQLGWVYQFKRDSTGKMFFRDEAEWDIEPGAGNS